MFINRDQMNSARTGLGVRQLVTELRTELQALDRDRLQAAPDSAGLLRLGEANIEVSFVVKESSSAKGSANFEIVTLESGMDVSHEQVQKLSIKLMPMSRTGSAPPEN
jgi:hypothetical protein